ncbi:MAG: hypothetical protein QOH93_1839 [Chloroflexia bacterium]|jgi:hypothetical protein|nr:hypothetical protein [Chloroflexia bacterium]
MYKVSETAIIERPPVKVFPIAADPETQLHWDPGTLKSVEKLTPGPLGQGSRYRGKFKGFGTMEYEFAEYESPRRFAHLAPMAMGKLRHTFTFEAVPQGTRLTQEGRLEPNLLGRILWPVMSRMLRSRFRLIASEVSQYMQGEANANAKSIQSSTVG